jgi:hypothetical protein
VCQALLPLLRGGGAASEAAAAAAAAVRINYNGSHRLHDLPSD